MIADTTTAKHVSELMLDSIQFNSYEIQKSIPGYADAKHGQSRAQDV